MTRSALVVLSIAALAGCSSHEKTNARRRVAAADQRTAQAEAELMAAERRHTEASIARATELERNLEKIDRLDYEGMSAKKSEGLSGIYAKDVLVRFPDGHETRGLADEQRELQNLFSFAPDVKVTSHPVRFGSSEWTCVSGVLNGTFSEPMNLPDGSVIPPTNRRFTIPMARVSRWKDGRIIEEQLYWDNGALMQQVGIER